MTNGTFDATSSFGWPDIFSEFIYTRTYSRWLEDKGRREFWPETVKRYYDFFLSRIPETKHGDFAEVCKAILDLNVMPSMRALWTAGLALEKENLVGYNCAYIQIDHIKAFGEMLYLLMCGTGVGYSVERQYINQLPSIPEKLLESSDIIEFKDSKRGWANGVNQFIKGLYDGKIYKLDFSKIRPAGSRLKTFGGRASGPEPLIGLCEYLTMVFKGALGRKMNSLEIFDICCKIPELVVVGRLEAKRLHMSIEPFRRTTAPC